MIKGMVAALETVADCYDDAYARWNKICRRKSFNALLSSFSIYI